MKTAIIILSDPNAGEEALGRALNAFALAHESRAAGDEIAIEFIGTGTRWPAELSRLAHPGHALFDSVRDLVVGGSCACAALYGATEGLQACGIPLNSSNALPGTSGLSSIRRYLAEGWQTLIF